MNGYNLISIIGQTACGKTGLGVEVALRYNGAVLSADSRQVYKGLDIGSGKDYDTYIVDGVRVPTYLIDIIDPSQEYHLFSYISDFNNAYDAVISEGRVPVLVGGSGMYISAVIQNYLPKKISVSSERLNYLNSLSEEELTKILSSKNLPLHNITDFENKSRLITAILISESPEDKYKQEKFYRSLTFLVDPGKETVTKRIEERLEQRLKTGMIEEVENLIKNNLTGARLYSLGLEYRYVSSFINGEITYDEMFRKLFASIVKFAKRQRTWFRKMEREGVEMIKLDGSDSGKIFEVIEEKKKAGYLSELMPA